MNDQFEVTFIWGYKKSLPFVVDRVIVRCGEETQLRRFVTGFVYLTRVTVFPENPEITYTHNNGSESETVSLPELDSLMSAWGLLREKEGLYILIVNSPWPELSGVYVYRDGEYFLSVLYEDYPQLTEDPIKADLVRTYHQALDVPMPE